MTRKQMMNELVKIQNKPEYQNQNILTFTGFLNDEELKKYLEDRR